MPQVIFVLNKYNIEIKMIASTVLLFLVFVVKFSPRVSRKVKTKIPSLHLAALLYEVQSRRK